MTAINRDLEEELNRIAQDYKNRQATKTMGAIHSGNLWINNPNIFQSVIYPDTANPNMMLYNAQVERVENGFILRVIHKQGDVAKVYVAHNADELRDLFIAAIVDERISK